MKTGKLIQWGIIAVLGFLALRWFSSFASGIAGQLAPQNVNANALPPQPQPIYFTDPAWYNYGPYYAGNPFYSSPDGVPWAPGPGPVGPARHHWGVN